MFKLCIFITGYSGAGKSTLANYLSINGFCSIHTGTLFRDYGLSDANESSVTPISAEDMITDKLMFFLREHMNHTGPSLCVIETCPRGVHQIEMMSVAKKMGWVVICLGMTAHSDVCRARVMSRNMANPSRMENDERKMIEEIDVMVELFAALRTGDTPFFEIDTTSGTYNYGEEYAATGRFVKTACNLFRMRTGRVTPTKLGHTDLECADHLINRAMGELAECKAAGTVDHKFEEIVDAFIFLFVALGTLGIEPEKIVEGILKKSKINNFRFETGTKPHGFVLDKDGKHE